MTDDPQTECEVYVEEWFYQKPPAGTFGPPSATLGQKREFLNTIGFSYSNDVVNLGDPFSFSIANPAGRYRDHFQRGARVKFYLKNPSVNGGQRTLKHDGIVVTRGLRADRGGCFLDITCADLGWHLRENDAPLWYVLQGGTFEGMLKDPKFIDPSWGIKGPVTDNETTRLIRRGKNNSRAQVAIDMQAIGTLVHIQVEPGDKVADLILTYARRIGRLFTVSPDGYMQLWRPDVNQPSLYSINFHGFDENNRSLNTVISCQGSEDISQIFTVVTCIGEIVGGDIQQDTTNQNAAKRIGTFRNSRALPFRHNINFCDGDIFNGTEARKQAQWRYDRGCFDSWSMVYVVRGHHCQGNWWEADTMVTVHDSVHGLDGDFYISSVVYTRDEQGDKTQVTIRLPGLLQASYGVFKRAPRFTAPTAIPKSVIETATGVKVSVATGDVDAQ